MHNAGDQSLRGSNTCLQSFLITYETWISSCLYFVTLQEAFAYLFSIKC